MSRRKFFYLAGMIVLAGCGGGGVFSPPTDREDRFTVGPDEFDQTFGEIRLIIAAGTFPAGTNLTLTQSAQAPSLPPTEHFSLAKPALRLSADQIASWDITLAISNDGRSYIAARPSNNGWLPLAFSRDSSEIQFVLPAQSGLAPTQSLGSIWEAVIGLVRDNRPDTDYGVHHLSGSSDFGAPGTILCLHGILDNWQSMRLVGEQALADLGGSGVFSFAFDWRQGAEMAGNELASFLSNYRHRYKNVTIVAYSHGVLVARQALEQLSETAAVWRCFFLMGPNLGSPIADPVDWLFHFGRAWLNGSFACSPFAITIDDPALRELRPGSDFLNTLNSYHAGQTGDVSYYLFAGGNDWVVSEASAVASGVELRELTGGGAWARTIPDASHFNIKTDRSLLDLVFGSVGLDLGNRLSIFLEPSPVNAQTYGWFFSLRIRNETNAPLTLTDLALVVFDRDGVWYTTEWYDPNTLSGDFFPTRHAFWFVSLEPGETTSAIDIQLWPDYARHTITDPDLPANLKAKAVQFLLSAEQNNALVKAETTLICHDDDIWPTDPGTRSPYPLEGQVGVISRA